MNQLFRARRRINNCSSVGQLLKIEFILYILCAFNFIFCRCVRTCPSDPYYIVHPLELGGEWHTGHSSMIGTLHSNNFNLHSPSNCSRFSQGNTYDSSGDRRTKYFHATQHAAYSHADIITVCHNHTDNRWICPDCVEIVFHSNRFLPGRLNRGLIRCHFILLSISTSRWRVTPRNFYELALDSRLVWYRWWTISGQSIAPKARRKRTKNIAAEDLVEA